MLKNALGATHPLVGMSLNNLALVYQTEGRITDAEPLFKRATAIAETAFGGDNRHLGESLNNLAELYRGQGRLAEAEPLYKRALAIYDKRQCPENVGVTMALNKSRPAVSGPEPHGGGRTTVDARNRDHREGTRTRSPRYDQSAEQPSVTVLVGVHLMRLSALLFLLERKPSSKICQW